MMRTPSALRWFWRIYIPMAAILLFGLVALPFGPLIETHVFPIRINNENVRPTRSPGRVCWTWTSDKLRSAFGDNVDVFLDILDDAGKVRNTFVPSLYRALTDEPWQSGNVLPLGHSEIPYCIDLPRIAKAEQHIRVRFTPILHGWLDLWPLPIHTPDMVDPPWAEAPL